MISEGANAAHTSASWATSRGECAEFAIKRLRATPIAQAGLGLFEVSLTSSVVAALNRLQRFESVYVAQESRYAQVARHIDWVVNRSSVLAAEM